METVKVDMQKLQLLNERIAQTIDALNQVRMSVHGLQHTPPIGAGAPNFGYGVYGQPAFGQQSPYGFYSPMGLSQPGYGQPFPQFQPQFAPGFQHTSPVSTIGWTQPNYTTPTYATPTYATQQAYFTPTFAQANGLSGLSHSAWEPRTWAFGPTLY